MKKRRREPSVDKERTAVPFDPSPSRGVVTTSATSGAAAVATTAARPADADPPVARVTTSASVGPTLLCQWLQSDDLRVVHKGLRHFVATVRRERKVSLRSSPADEDSLDDDDDDDMSHEIVEDNDESPSTRTKKTKKKAGQENWMEDTRRYNVPFVGTSVLAADAYRVVPGTWPTGLLEAYLRQSPRGSELVDHLAQSLHGASSTTSASKASGKDHSRRVGSLRRLHAEALAELVTAAVPRDKLVARSPNEYRARPSEVGSAPTESPFLGDVVKRAVPLVLRSLQVANKTKTKDETVASEASLLLQLAPAVFRLLTNVSMTSPSVARQVVQAWDAPSTTGQSQGSSMSVIFRRLLRWKVLEPSPLPTSSAAGVASAVKAKTRMVELATTLVEHQQVHLLSSLATSGSHGDRKEPQRSQAPGLVFLIFQHVLDLGLESENADPSSRRALAKALRRLVEAVHRSLLHESGGKAMLRVLADLFNARDCMSNLLQLSTDWAPPLGDFRDVLVSRDAYDDDGGAALGKPPPAEAVGIAARRLLFTLLIDPAKSPLLALTQMAEQTIVRAMILLWNKSPTGIAIQPFLIRCLETTPQIMIPFLRVVPVPECSVGQGLPFCRSLRFLIQIMESSVFRQSTTVKEWPFHLLKKPQLVKALDPQQDSHSPLAATVALHFVMHVARCPVLDASEKVKALPESLAVVRSVSSAWGANDSSKDRVAFWACAALPHLAKIVSSTGLDWVKFLVPAADIFARQPVFLQRKLMGCLEQLLGSGALSTGHAQSSPRALMDIILSTRDSHVYRSARLAALSLFPEFSREKSLHGDSETNLDFQYEYSCWIDGLTQETLEEFCALIRQASPELIRSRLALVRAWDKLPGDVPRLNVSPLLIHALSTMNESSATFRALACQVATRCLMHHYDPLPLAALCVSSLSYTNAGKNQLALLHYSFALIHFDDVDAKDRIKRLSALLTLLFDNSSFLVALTKRPSNDVFNDMTHVPADELNIPFRQMAHFLLVSPEQDQPSLFRLIFQSLIPRLLRCNCGNIKSIIKRLLALPSTTMSHEALRWADLLIRASENRDFLDEFEFWDASSNVSALRSAQSQESLLSVASYVYVVAPFVPAKCLPQWLLVTLEVTMRYSAFRPLALLIVQRAVAENVHKQESGALVASRALNYWVMFPDNEMLEDRSLVLGLDQLLASFLTSEASPRISIALEHQFAELGIETVIRRCVTVKRLGSARDTSTCLLARLVELNNLDYAAALLSLIASHDEDLRKSILELGVFDDVVLLALRSPGATAVHGRATALIANSYVGQVLDMLDRKSSSTKSLRSANLLLAELIRFDCLSRGDSVDLTDALQETLVQLLHPTESPHFFDAFEPSYQVEILHLATLLCLNQTKTQQSKRHPLASVLIFRLLVQLSSADRSSLSSSRKLVSWATKLLEANFPFCEPFDWSSVVDSTVQKCLTIGLGLEQLEQGLLEDYFKFCIALTKVSTTTLRDTSNSLASSTLLTITSHPNFHTLLVNASSVKSLLLDLMLLCASTARSFDVGEATVDALLEGFDASTTYSDTLIRLLLFEFCRRQTHVHDKNLYGLTLERLRWRGLPPAHSDSGWMWLPDAIDFKRVQATLSAFPIEDPLAMDAESCEKVSCALLGNSVTTRVYSPGFILPLVLAGLDSICPAIDGSGSRSLHLRDESLLLAHRLCDKGCLAMSLASLCCADNSMRRLAMSILGVFTTIIESDAARTNSTWRERPQVSLLLQSVRKAFCIRIGESSRERLVVPRLPGLSALFLARASLILSRPSDDMYSAMNRYFLQSTTDHGAFQDAFRVPGFVALFNSASDEAGLAKIHRLWALRLVRDGFLDEDCLKPLLSCHALPLFLTSFDSFRIRNETGSSAPHDETVLLLSILNRVLKLGGAKAQEFLLGQVGILHWLHSVLVGRPIEDLLPDCECRLLFVRLACRVLDGAEAYHEMSEIRDWCNRTAQPIVDIALTSLVSNDTYVCHPAEKLAKCVAEFFNRILRFVADTEATRSRTHGIIDFSSMLELLKRVPEATRVELILNLCRIPIAGTAERSDLEYLATQVLKVLESTQSFADDSHLLELVLERVPHAECSLPKELARRFANLRWRFNGHASTQHRYELLIEAL